MSEMIPPGYYNAVAVPVDVGDGRVWAQFGETDAGMKQVVLAFEILDGPEAGRRISWFGYFGPKSTDRTIESLRLCGFTGDDLAQVPQQQLLQKVSITVEHSEWDGKVRAKVAWVNRPGGGGVKLDKPMDPNGLRLFAASLRAKVKSKPVVAGERVDPTATPQPREPETAPPPDDSIPF